MAELRFVGAQYLGKMSELNAAWTGTWRCDAYKPHPTRWAADYDQLTIFERGRVKFTHEIR